MPDASISARGGRELGKGKAEPSQFRSIYDEHFGFVRRTLRRLGVSAMDAGDLAQVVFLVAHARLDAFEGRCRLITSDSKVKYRLRTARQHFSREAGRLRLIPTRR